jgi:ABC-type transporter MlaC component
MKRILLALALLAAPIALHAAAKPSDTLKLNLPKTQDLIKALLALDGSTRLDKDNAQVQVGYSFPAATRIAVSHDIKALTDHQQEFLDSWKAYLKGAGITDETKETDAQKKEINDLLSTDTEIKVILLDENDLESKDNPIPPTILTRLLPLIK